MRFLHEKHLNFSINVCCSAGFMRKKEKTDESLSADKAVVTETSDVIYTAMVVKMYRGQSDSLWNRLEAKMPLQYGSFGETGKICHNPYRKHW